MTYDVYWIRKKEHTDILKDGYVGVTKNRKKRFNTHLSGKSSPKLTRALKKYKDDIVFDIIEQCNTKEEACEIEAHLRPTSQIGWNIAPGGGYPPPITDYPEAIEKLKKRIKELGTMPYCEKTHSPESIAKALETKRKKCYRIYHNPETFEYRYIPTGIENPPEGWVKGRKPKVEYKPKERGVDYLCNVMTVDIFLNDKCIARNVTNFKQWCNDNNLPYFAGSKTNSIKILRKKKKVIIEKKMSNVWENGVNTYMIQKEYAESINKSESYISSALKRGYYEIKHYDVYSFVRLR